MTIEQIDTVDAIGVDKESNEVILTLIDHLEWDDQHMLLLQDKINTYLDFVESGQLVDIYPDAINKQVRINMVCIYKLSELAVEFIRKVNSLGIKLTYEYKSL